MYNQPHTNYQGQQQQTPQQPKKTFTMEDNVRTIAFALKDLVKQVEELNSNVSRLTGPR